MSKIALVSGGSRGLGKDMVLNLANKGLDVIFTYNSKENEANEVAKQVEAAGKKAAAIQLSVDNQKGFDDFFGKLQNILDEKFGGEKINYLINNAGVGLPTKLGETDENTMDTLFNIHVKSPYFLVR